MATKATTSSRPYAEKLTESDRSPLLITSRDRIPLTIPRGSEHEKRRTQLVRIFFGENIPTGCAPGHAYEAASRTQH